VRIVYIDIDACNPEHLGCYGYPRNTSPRIDRIAQEGTLLTNCYASDAPCLPSRTALYSGRFGIQTGVVGHGGTAAEPRGEGQGRDFQDSFTRDGLASQLKDIGYHTTLVSPFAERHSAHWFNAGFAEIHNTGLCGMESVEEVLPVVGEWLSRRGREDDWYLHVNFWDAHTPYRVPARYGEPFAGEALPPWLEDSAQLKRHMELPGPHTALDVGMYGDGPARGSRWDVARIDSTDALRRWIDGYDTAIRYVDDAIGRIVDQLRELGVYEDTAIVISADHGECQGHLGIYGEHGTADQGTCRIPLIVRWPGGRQGAVDSELHYHVDWAPTLIEMAGSIVPESYDGKSFARSLSKGEHAGRDYLVLSQCAHVCQRSVRWDRWLYIRTYHDGFHDYPEEMLFDLRHDPREQRNAATQNPEACREGARTLERWRNEQLQKMVATSGGASDPLWTVMREGGPFHARTVKPGMPGSPEAIEAYFRRLEETGRAPPARRMRARSRPFRSGT